MGAIHDHPTLFVEADTVCPAYEALHDGIKMQSCPTYEDIHNYDEKTESCNTIKDVTVTDTSQVENKPVPIYLTVY